MHFGDIVRMAKCVFVLIRGILETSESSSAHSTAHPRADNPELAALLLECFANTSTVTPHFETSRKQSL